MFDWTILVERKEKNNVFSRFLGKNKKNIIIHKFYLTKKYPQPVHSTHC